MAFKARLTKPCTQCGIDIPAGTSGNFTWDRVKGGFIHLDCLQTRKANGAKPQEAERAVVVTENGVPVPEVEKTFPMDAQCGVCTRTWGSHNGVRCPGKTTEFVLTKPRISGATLRQDGYRCDTCDMKLPDADQMSAHIAYEHPTECRCQCGIGDAKEAELHLHFCPLAKRKAVKAADVRGDNPRLSADTAHELARMIQTLAGARGIDEAAVRRIAADEAAKVSTNRSITITVGEAPEIKLDLAHKDVPLLVKVVSMYGANGHRPNVYMHGPAGSGKSTAARQASIVLNLPYGYISLNPQTPDSRLLGYMHAGGEYVASEFFKRYTEGGVFCIDEIDNAAASLVTTLNGLLENGHGAFPHGVYQRHKDFVCICTANTIGRGGDVNYPERRALDGAFLERFMFLTWEYDHDLTKAIVTGILGNATAEFMAWIRQEGEEMQSRYPTLIVSPRAFIQGASLEKIGLSRNQIRPMVISRGLK